MNLTTSWTQTDFVERLEPLGLCEEDRPQEFKQYCATVGKRAYEISSAGWSVAGGKACARSARITGPAMDIATVMLYPTQSPEILPVFAAEWVVFGNSIHTLVLDVEVCGAHAELIDAAGLVLTNAHRRWVRHFPLNRDKPRWFEDIETPWAIFGQAEGEKMSLLRSAFLEYLDLTIEELYARRIDSAVAGADHSDVQDYKHHHYINSPGHRILGVKFGEVHTDRLLKDWHFGPSRGAIAAEAAPA